MIVHESTDLAEIDRTRRNYLRLTTPVRTIIDLAAVAGPHRLEQALEDGLRRRLFTAVQLAHRFTAISRRGKRGMRKLRIRTTCELAGLGAELRSSPPQVRERRGKACAFGSAGADDDGAAGVVMDAAAELVGDGHEQHEQVEADAEHARQRQRRCRYQRPQGRLRRVRLRPR